MNKNEKVEALPRIQVKNFPGGIFHRQYILPGDPNTESQDVVANVKYDNRPLFVEGNHNGPLYWTNQYRVEIKRGDRTPEEMENQVNILLIRIQRDLHTDHSSRVTHYHQFVQNGSIQVLFPDSIIDQGNLGMHLNRKKVDIVGRNTHGGYRAMIFEDQEGTTTVRDLVKGYSPAK
jgi:hypothetical protein|tara:strand:- start:283 stop:810 length:528 start_codon:yes stop_codon:yes gene_type:complete